MRRSSTDMRFLSMAALLFNSDELKAMNEQHETQPFGRNTCHVCGGTDFTWGKLIDHSGTNFLTDENARKLLGSLKSEKMRARKCNKW